MARATPPISKAEMDLTLIEKIAIFALPVIFAITLHEAAHGYVARFFGDMTAARAGRITINPIKHIDLIGTLLVPLVILTASKLLGGGAILFGWAKPVPVDFSNLRNPKKDMLWVAAAGPGINFLMALFWALVIQTGILLDNSFSETVMRMGAAGVFINVILMALNLIPLPPLDGGRIAVSLLPLKAARAYAKIEPYGFFILLGLLFTGVLNLLLWPLISVFTILIAGLTGLESSHLLGLIQLVLN